MTTHAVISIGYEGRTPSELLALLHSHRVRKVLDVRELPLSRRKGFSKTPLSGLLADDGIAYRHLREAGNPHRHSKGDLKKCLALYSDYIAAHPDVVSLVDGELKDGPVAVLCFERHHRQCHRSRLLSAIKRRRRRTWRVIRVE